MGTLRELHETEAGYVQDLQRLLRFVAALEALEQLQRDKRSEGLAMRSQLEQKAARCYKDIALAGVDVVAVRLSI